MLSNPVLANENKEFIAGGVAVAVAELEFVGTVEVDAGIIGRVVGGWSEEEEGMWRKRE